MANTKITDKKKVTTMADSDCVFGNFGGKVGQMSIPDFLYNLNYDNPDSPESPDLSALRRKIDANTTKISAVEDKNIEQDSRINTLLRDTPWEGKHMNSFTETGEYHIHGERTDANDGLPILNEGTIDARLTVLDSSLTNGTGAKTDICVTQVLRISNRTGGDGNIYVRTSQAATKEGLMATNSTKWGTWEKLMGIFEKNAVKNIADLDTYTTNGMYSGLFADTTLQTLGGLQFTPGDTFLLITVNGYAASAFGAPQLTQMLYRLPSKKGSGNNSARMYMRTAYWDKNADPKAWVFANWDRLAMASEISGGGGGSIEEYNRLIELIAANTTKITSVESTANDAKSAAETAQTAAETAQGTANSAQTAATEAKTAAQEAKTAAENAQNAAENEATARTEADTELQSQINGKQDNIGSFSADEKNAFLVSLGLGKIGVISQKQNWNASNTEYTISDKVMGVIPQSFIAEWIDATKAWYDPYGGPISHEIQEGSFNEQTGYFELHGLTDLTYYDARMIMLYGRRLDTNCFPCANSLGVRTIHVPTVGSLWTNAIGLLVPPDAEVVKCPIGWTKAGRWLLKKTMYDDLNMQNKLHTIEYVMINGTHVTNLPALRNCKIKIDGNGVILNLAKSPLLTIQSVKDMIELSYGSCTITLHKDVYDAAMADESILAALEAHTNISLASV